MTCSLRTSFVCAWLIACGSLSAVGSADDAVVGPRTEARFPPLVVPQGFKVTLFACDPLVEYPSVIALGPRAGTLFVAYDYMTGLGEEIIRRDEVRLLADTDGDGYADQSTLFADGFNSIQGLAYDGEAVYVMHAPFLTRVSDTDGDEVADERRDLLSGLGLPPEENSNRLHCANGVVVGHDGWLYLALGDRGCDTERAEGDRLVFQQGGILRCRTDGTDLHVFSTGLRNIYDIALDDELNVFVRDNENDGGDYLLRVSHCFFGSDHGYPYHYYERPDELMPPLVELGRGSSAGLTTYLETAFPQEYRSSLYACEWGRAVVRYPLVESGSGFAPTHEIDFAVGAADDPYGFHPTDLVVDYDGSLLISDWCDGQRPKRGRGRIYRIEANGAEEATAIDVDGLSDSELIARLDSPSHHTRVAAQRAILQRNSALDELQAAWKNGQLGVCGKLHAIWIIALSSDAATEELTAIAHSESDARVIVQAVRAIADCIDPVLLENRLNAEAADLQVGVRLEGLFRDNPHDEQVAREVVIALSRVKYVGGPILMRYHLYQWDLDSALSHAVVHILRRCSSTDAVFELLDIPPGSGPAAKKLRKLALLALAEQADSDVVDGLIERLAAEPLAERRIEYIDLLSRVARLPAPWIYWGFRPGPRPVNTVVWERTEAIESVFARSLVDPDLEVRSFALQRMIREDLKLTTASLATWLDEDTDPDRVAAILDALPALPFDETLPLLEACVTDRRHAESNRLESLRQLSLGLDAVRESRLLTSAEAIEDGPVLAALLAELGERPAATADSLLLSKLDSHEPVVRAAAIEALTVRNNTHLCEHVGRLLDDSNINVIREAVAACGVFELREHVDRILSLADDADAELQLACLVALRRLEDARAVPAAIAGLEDAVTQLASLEYLERFGDSSQLAAVVKVAASSSDASLQIAGIRALSAWSDSAEPVNQINLRQAIARIQGQSGNLLCWRLTGPMSASQADAALADALTSSTAGANALAGSVIQIAENADARIPLDRQSASEGSVWLSATDVFIDEANEVEFLASNHGTIAVWLNDALVFERSTAGEFRPNSDVFSARLEAGSNRILIRLDGSSEASQFHLNFRRRSSKAEHEQLLQFVLAGSGDVARGREIFLNAEKSQCTRCHRMRSDGPRIGPDLTGIGSRFSRVHILESILEPSRTIAPSYATVAVALADGQIITGIIVAEDESTLTIGDNQGKLHEIPVDEVDEMIRQDVSTMPVGLEQRMTQQELLDLIEFLTQQKK